MLVTDTCCVIANREFATHVRHRRASHDCLLGSSVLIESSKPLLSVETHSSIRELTAFEGRDLYAVSSDRQTLMPIGCQRVGPLNEPLGMLARIAFEPMLQFSREQTWSEQTCLY